MKRYFLLILLIVGCNTNGIQPSRITKISPIPMAVLSRPQGTNPPVVVRAESPRGKDTFKTPVIVQPKVEVAPAKPVEKPEKKMSLWRQAFNLIAYYSVAGVVIWFGLGIYNRFDKKRKIKSLKASQK
jgi:hypothetical protein